MIPGSVQSKRHPDTYTTVRLLPWQRSVGWIWKAPCYNKIRFFIWKCTHNRLPKWKYLAHIENGISQDCPHCIQPESTIHVLQDCHWAREFWIAFLGNLQLDFFQLPLLCWLHQNLENNTLVPNHHIPWNIIFAFGLWQLWLSRNATIFRSTNCLIHQIKYRTLHLALEY